MRTLHDFFQRRTERSGDSGIEAGGGDDEADDDGDEDGVDEIEADERRAGGGDDDDIDESDESDADVDSPLVSPPAAGDDAAAVAPIAAALAAAPPRKRVHWVPLSSAERQRYWESGDPERPRRRRRTQRHARDRAGSFQATRHNELLGRPIEAWRRVYRRSWAAPLSMALENRDQVELRGSSWGGEAARVARQNGVRDVVVDMQFDQVGALLAAACRDGRVQVHDFDEFATRLLMLNGEPDEDPAEAAADGVGSGAAQASDLPPRCADTDVLTLVAPRQVGAGVAWDPTTESHLWTWYHSSNAIHLYDIERCRPDTPTRVYKPSASAASVASELSVGVTAAQFATAGSTAILSTVFAVGSRGGTVFFYDKRSKTVPIYSIEGRYGGVTSMQLSVDGQLLLFSTTGGRQCASPMLMGYDVRAICSNSGVGREGQRRVLGEKQGARGCLLSVGVDASFRAPRPPCAEDIVTYVRDPLTGQQRSRIQQASATEWTYGDRGGIAAAVTSTASKGWAVPATMIALPPCGANELAYQLEDGAVGQLDLAQLCSSYGRSGVDERGGAPLGRTTSAGSTRQPALPFTQPPMPAQRRFQAGFASGGLAQSGARSHAAASVFYHDTHASLASASALSLHDFSAPARRPTGLGERPESEEAAHAVWRARHPLAMISLGNVARPSAIAFHPAGESLVIGGEKNTIFVRQMGEPPSKPSRSEVMAMDARGESGPAAALASDVQASAGNSSLYVRPSAPSAVADPRAAARAARAAAWAQAAAQ